MEGDAEETKKKKEKEGVKKEKKAKKEKKGKKEKKTKKEKKRRHESDEDPAFAKLKEGLAHIWATRFKEADECFESTKDEDAQAACLYAECAWVQVHKIFCYILVYF